MTVENETNESVHVIQIGDEVNINVLIGSGINRFLFMQQGEVIDFEVVYTPFIDGISDESILSNIALGEFTEADIIKEFEEIFREMDSLHVHPKEENAVFSAFRKVYFKKLRTDYLIRLNGTTEIIRLNRKQISYPIENHNFSNAFSKYEFEEMRKIGELLFDNDTFSLDLMNDIVPNVTKILVRAEVMRNQGLLDVEQYESVVSFGTRLLLKEQLMK